jgi:hypothetical protein
VRLSRSWFGCLVKGVMRAAEPAVNVSSEQPVHLPTDKPNPV